MDWIKLPKPVKPDFDFEIACPKCGCMCLMDDNYCAECGFTTIIKTEETQ